MQMGGNFSKMMSFTSNFVKFEKNYKSQNYKSQKPHRRKFKRFFFGNKLKLVNPYQKRCCIEFISSPAKSFIASDTWTTRTWVPALHLAARLGYRRGPECASPAQSPDWPALSRCLWAKASLSTALNRSSCCRLSALFRPRWSSLYTTGTGRKLCREWLRECVGVRLPWQPTPQREGKCTCRDRYLSARCRCSAYSLLHCS